MLNIIFSSAILVYLPHYRYIHLTVYYMSGRTRLISEIVYRHVKIIIMHECCELYGNYQAVSTSNAEICFSLSFDPKKDIVMHEHSI